MKSLFAGKWWHPLILMVFLVLGIAAVSRGLHLAFTAEFGDGRLRATEYEVFKSGQYPNHNISNFPEGTRRIFSVYPPYAFPVFSLFFEPAGAGQGVIVLSVLSLASLFLIGYLSNRRYRADLPDLHALVWILPFATGGISSALALGQFSIICVTLILLQIMLLEKKRPVAAGICWAFAMIKPQIGILFAPLFLLDHQLRGLTAGTLLLMVLSALSCWWTSTGPDAIAEYYLFKLNLKHFTGGWMEGPGQLASTLGLNLQLMTGLALFLLTLMVIPIYRRFGHAKNNPRLLFLAGALALAGKLLFYNRIYDTIMLWPAMISVIILARQRKGKAFPFLAVLFLISVILPGQWLMKLPWLALPMTILWVATILLLVQQGLRDEHPPEASKA